jgi:hypothetical protein
MEYTIVKAYDVDVLTKEVNKLMAEGWKPIGGVGVGNSFYQAMVKGE